MRLVNTKTIQLEFFNDEETPSYAILSHTWEQEEILFHDIGLEGTKLKKGYAKLKSCCRVARENGFNYIWDDTCCIDKSSSAELSEAINSMYRYYQQANVCYVYLADVSAVSEIPGSRWFTRGWTLQELIAPRHIIFFDKHWQKLGTKESLVKDLSERTKIPESILYKSDNLDTASVAQRMSWAADRVTTRREDSAYCLMGLFDINMPLLYGEGDKAFYRLQEEIMRVSDDHSLFAWEWSAAPGGLLAPTPAAFKQSGDIIPWNPFAPYNRPFTVTNKGVHIEAPFIAQDVSGRALLVLCCTTVGRKDKLIAVSIKDIYLTMEHFERCRTYEYQYVDLNTFNLIRHPVRSLCIRLHMRAKTRRNATTGEGMLVQADRPKSGVSLSEAAVRGDAGTIWFLLAQSIPGVHEITRDEIRLAICLAAQYGHEDLLNQLMNRRDTADLVNVDGEGRTPLFHAAEGGQEHTLRFILSSARILPDTRDSYGRTALWYAVYHRHNGCANILLQTGMVSGNVGGQGNTKSALWHATSAGNLELVKLLVHHGALVGIRGESPLYLAVADENLAIAEVLLENGAEPDWQDAEMNTPFHLACRNDNRDMIALLIRYGANADKSDTSGKTELAFATLRGNVALVRFLLENGVNPKAKCANGKTASFYARGKEMKSLLSN